jgi:hypothetical protein
VKAKTNRLALERPSAARTAKEQRELSFDGPEARLNITLPAAVHARVKVRAAEKRQTIRTYILGLLQKDGIDVRAVNE